MNPPRRKRVLLVKLGAIGDVVMLIPAAHELHLRGYDIDWLCGSAVAPLLGCYSWIRTLVADESSLLTGGVMARLIAILTLWKRLAWKPYDLVATLYYDRRYRLLTLPIPARKKLVLLASGRETSLHPNLHSGRHHSDEYARILLNALGSLNVDCQTVAPVRPGLLPPSPLPRSSGGVRVIVVPAGARNLLREDLLRRWPLENYVGLANCLLTRGVEVLLVGGPDDDWAVPAFRGLPVLNLIGSLSLPQSVALMNDCDVMVTHDTGPLHLGGIASIGIVSIFGPTDPHTRLPSRPGALALWGGERLPCRPCYDGSGYPACPHNACMQQVTVEMVFASVMRMLEQRELMPMATRHFATPSSIMS